MRDDITAEALDRLAASAYFDFDFAFDWDDVLARADVSTHAAKSPGWRSRKRVLVAAIVVVVLLVPIGAFAAANATDWWFGVQGVPSPARDHAPVVVKTGSWDGHPWTLVGYRTDDDDLCYAIGPSQSATTGEGAALSCGPLREPAPGEAVRSVRSIGISIGGGAAGLPRYAVGPVVATAETVAISLKNGDVLRVPTFEAPASLGDLRFYATQLPNEGDTSDLPILRVVAVAADGQEVACLSAFTVVCR
jgi:hypothetical protein